jgi:hypothetical protein
LVGRDFDILEAPLDRDRLQQQQGWKFGDAPKNWCDRLQLSLQAILQVMRGGS